MSTKNDTSWMPPNGSYPVSIGSSLAGALKANKGLPQAPKLFDRGFYSFRYNFKPESIDLHKPGTIEVKREGDRKTATIERASTAPGEGQLFTGAEIAAKDVDCVLVYDEELGTFTLEKLDSLINVNWGGKSTMPSNRPSGSPAHTTPSAPVPPVKKEYGIDLDLNAELERDLLSVVEDVPPKRSSIKQEPPSLKASTSSTPNATSGSQSLPKKPKPKPKEPAPMFMNPNSAAARVANKKSAPPKREPKPEPKLEQKPPALSQPTPVSKVARLAGDLKSKAVKRRAEPEVAESSRVPKRPKPSPPPSKTQPQPRSGPSKLPPLAAGLPPKPQTTLVPPPQPYPKPQLPAKKEFSLELPTGFSPASSSRNPLLASGSGGTSLSLPTGTSTPTHGNIQPSPSTLAEAAPAVLSDSESDWDEVDADGPSPPNPPSLPHTEPQPYRLGSLTIEEDPPAGFNGTLDIVDGDENQYDDDGDGEGVDIDMDDLMAEMDEQLQDGEGGEPEGEGDLNDPNEMEDFDFLAAAVSPEPEQDQEGYQDGDVGSYAAGDMFGDDDYSSSSDDSDD